MRPRERQAHVRRIPGAASLVDGLRGRYRLAVVSNTNDERMVPTLVSELFTPGSFHTVMLSVQHGYRKPHPSIYDAARSGLPGSSCSWNRRVLIDPMRRYPQVPENRRLDHIEDLSPRLE